MTKLIVSCGDPSGIGPRLATQVLNEPGAKDWCVYLTGPPTLWRSLGIKEGPNRYLVGAEAGSTKPGEPCLEGAHIQTHALLQALDIIDSSQADALVTLPINKLQLRAAKQPFAGHTELFRSRYPHTELVMSFRSHDRWVALATDHIPLNQVASGLTTERLMTAVKALHHASGKTVAVCGLNPHAGEAGMLGTEELKWQPTIDRLRALGIPCRGFLPADGLFARWKGKEAILALYHDQGLAPFKALTANQACQISLGLPFIRTSPDHGTAYDLAKTNEGDPGSTRIAFETALSLANSRLISASD
jgi:4-hydroxythreonine-4-phosphate dehydrogenase